MQLELTGRKAIMTGASKGIGKAVALGLAREGVDVSLCARGREVLEETAEVIRRQTHRQVLAIPADMTRLEDIRTVVRQTVEAFGRIDILVNNGGSPGAIRTELWETIAPKLAAAQNMDLAEFTRSMSPLSRPGTPEEVADVVVFLASERATYIHGAIIDIDGGLVSCI